MSGSEDRRPDFVEIQLQVDPADSPVDVDADGQTKQSTLSLGNDNNNNSSEASVPVDNDKKEEATVHEIVDSAIKDAESHAVAEAGASQATLRQPDNGSLLSKSLSRNISRTWSRVLPGPSDPDFRRLGIDNHCTYSFKDVAFGVGDRTLLHPCSGVFRGGQLVAIMGPSGSGKTTLLTMLGGKKTMNYTGEFFINGHPRDDAILPRITAYVPQADILEARLTVRECFHFYTTLKTQLDPAGVTKRVDWLVKNLQLEVCQSSYIGDNATRGISGGQKRRVSIGKGLIANPMMIFLDEPTSGLSATDAHTVIGCLRNIADQEKTLICCVIHQPRYSVFEMFDHLVLVSSGGKLSYNGPTKSLQTYFNMLGFEVPPNENAADYYLDVVTRGISDENDQNVDVITEAYQEHLAGRVKRAAENVPRGQTMDEIMPKREKAKVLSFDSDNKYARGMRFQWSEIVKQQFMLRMRNWPDIVRRCVTYIIAGVLLGVIFINGTYFIAGEALRYIAGIFTCMAFAAIFTLDQLPLLIDPKRGIYKSDHSDAFYSTGPYFWGISIPMWVEGIILTAIMATIDYWLVLYSSNAGVYVYFVFIIILLWWTTEGLMLMLAGVCKDTAMANGLTVGVIAFFLVFCGFLVNTGSSAAYLSWICYLSYFWYGWQALLNSVFDVWPGATGEDQFFKTSAEVFETFGIVSSLKYWPILIIPLWGLLFRLIAIYAYKNMWNPQI